MNPCRYQQLTFFPGDSRDCASLLVWLESKKVKGTTVTSGLKCLELSESLRRVGSSVRTYLESCVLPLPTLSRTWSVKAITSQCLILKLRLSARRTEGKESSSLDKGKLYPTPRANKTSGASSEGWGETLEQRVLKMWPTPNTSDAKGCGPAGSKSAEDKKGNYLRAAVLYPTPIQRDYKGGRQPETLKATGRKPSNSLPNMVMSLYGTPTATMSARSSEFARTTMNPAEIAKAEGGQLNPDWVEWLQGFPIGWTVV